MRKLLAIGFVALLAACSQTEEHPIQYGAARAPAANEQFAIDGAQPTLEAALAPLQPATQPGAGLTGLADQLAAQLSSYAAAAGMPVDRSAKLTGAVVREAFDMGTMPDCVLVDQQPDHTTVTWSGCHYEATDIDPTTGQMLATMAVDIAGSLTWSSVTGKTAWHVVDRTVTTENDTMSGQVFRMGADAELDGDVTVTSTEIGGWTSSKMIVSAMGITMGLNTSLTMKLGYETVPAFCVTSGTMTVEQRWDPRPAMATYQDYPDLGWRFDWLGCDQFTVTPGHN